MLRKSDAITVIQTKMGYKTYTKVGVICDAIMVV